MVQIKYTGDALWERIERAVEKVRDRLRRVVNALDAAGSAMQLWAVMRFNCGLLKSTNLLCAIRVMLTSF